MQSFIFDNILNRVVVVLVVLIVFLRVIFIGLHARVERSRRQVHLVQHLDVRLLTLDLVLFCIFDVVLLLVLVPVPLPIIFLLTVIILIVIPMLLLWHEKMLRLMLLVVLLLHIQLLLLVLLMLLLLLKVIQIFCLFRIHIHRVKNFTSLDGKAVSVLIGRDRNLKQIFSLVLLRNLITEFVSKGLVLVLSKHLLTATLLGKFYIDWGLLLCGDLGFRLILTRSAFHKRWCVIVVLNGLFLPATIRCVACADLHLGCTPSSDSSPLYNYRLDLLWLVRFLYLLRWVLRGSLRVAVVVFESISMNEALWSLESTTRCSPTTSRCTTAGAACGPSWESVDEAILEFFPAVVLIRIVELCPIVILLSWMDSLVGLFSEILFCSFCITCLWLVSFFLVVGLSVSGLTFGSIFLFQKLGLSWTSAILINLTVMVSLIPICLMVLLFVESLLGVLL